MTWKMIGVGMETIWVHPELRYEIIHRNGLGGNYRVIHAGSPTRVLGSFDCLEEAMDFAEKKGREAA